MKVSVKFILKVVTAWLSSSSGPRPPYSSWEGDRHHDRGHGRGDGAGGGGNPAVAVFQGPLNGLKSAKFSSCLKNGLKVAAACKNNERNCGETLPPPRIAVAGSAPQSTIPPATMVISAGHMQVGRAIDFLDMELAAAAEEVGL